MMGRLIYIMGPSGAGKDALLQGLESLWQARGCRIARRVITRPIDTSEPNTVPVTLTEFLEMEARDTLAMAWRANGLAYGVLREIDDKLEVGCDVLVNGSRAYLPEASKRYSNLVPVLLTVDHDILRQRLHQRGRETEEQIEARMARNRMFTSLTLQAADKTPNRIFVVDNSCGIDMAIQTVATFLDQGPVCA
ncbi:MAG TPA: phosphonate metabolism protein/1,5-bisphosphokinase (PRPP-forming) PhnN [Eoetvoesiella sp.]